MKKIAFLIIVIISILSCNNKEDTKEKITLKDSNKYIYFLPTDTSEIEAVLIVMDPHGEPNVIMDSLHIIANEMNIAIIGLKEIKNGLPNYEYIINRDLNHFLKLKRLKKKKIYLLGFSGTARMATNYAYNNRISGLIACGAGIGRNTQLPFPTILISGTRDFNFKDQYYSPSSERSFHKNIISLYFKGTHQWPPTYLIKNALNFIIERTSYNSKSITQSYSHIADSLYNEGDYFDAFKYMEAAYKFCNAPISSELTKKFEDYTNDREINAYHSRLEKYLDEENQRYEMLTHAIDIQDSIWWKNQINYMFSKANSNDDISSDSYARTISYLSMVIFYKINNIIENYPEKDMLSKYLYIYELSSPKNPDMYFFYSVYYYMNSDYENARKSFKTAEKNGYRNYKSLPKYFSIEFINTL